MVKTADNCGGASERKLRPKERKKLGLPEPHGEIMHTNFYKCASAPGRTSQVVEQSAAFIRSLHKQSRQSNLACLLFARPLHADRIGRPRTEFPPGLGAQFLGITRELGIRDGIIDLGGDDAGNYYVTDVNCTPSDRYSQPGILEHLRTAVHYTPRRRFGHWLRRS